MSQNVAWKLVLLTIVVWAVTTRVTQVRAAVLPAGL